MNHCWQRLYFIKTSVWLNFLSACILVVISYFSFYVFVFEYPSFILGHRVLFCSAADTYSGIVVNDLYDGNNVYLLKYYNTHLEPQGGFDYYVTELVLGAKL